jgi:hypothetical protein
LPKAFPPPEDFCFYNDKTKERLLTKLEEADQKVEKWKKVVLLMISRYPLASTRRWIKKNEKDILNWEFGAQNDIRIYLSKELKVVAI